MYRGVVKTKQITNSNLCMLAGEQILRTSRLLIFVN